MMQVCRTPVKCLWYVLLLANCSSAFSQPQKIILLKFLNEAQNHARFKNDSASVRQYSELANQYLYDKADSSLFYANKALALAESQKYTLGQVLAWQSISRARYVIGEFDKSFDAANHIMLLSTKLKYTPGIASAYELMGLTYLEQNKYQDAIATLNRALTLYTKLSDKKQIGKTCFNMAVSYDESQNTPKAFYFLAKAITTAQKVKDVGLVTMAENRTGEIYLHQHYFEKALPYYAGVAAAKASSTWERDFALSGMAQCYYGLGKYNLAIDAAQKSYKLSREVNSGSDVVRALGVLSQSYAAKKDYSKAYSYQVQFKKLNDSLYNSKKEKEINSLHLKQQEADNKRLEQQIKSKEAELDFKSRLLFFRNLASAVTGIFFIYLFLSNRQKTALNKVLNRQNEDISRQKEEITNQNEVLDKLNNTKNQLFSIISHDLRSPFSTIMQSIDIIRAGEFTPEEQGELMEDFYQQVNQVSIMVNNMLAWAASQQEGIKCHPALQDATQLAEEVLLLNSFIAKNKDLLLDHKYDGEKLIFADADHVRIIIQNLVGNAIKFTGRGGVIKVSYSQDLNFTAIHIKDSGVGVKPDKLDMLFKASGKKLSTYGTENEAGTGLGLSLVKQFTDANHGRLEVKSKSGEGSEFIVYLPKG